VINIILGGSYSITVRDKQDRGWIPAVVYPGIFFGGVSTNSVEDRENGDLGGSNPLVRGSGGSCNLVQEI